MIALFLSSLLLIGAAHDAAVESPLVIEIEVDLPPGYSPADFGFVTRPIRTSRNAFRRGCRRDRHCNRKQAASLFVDQGRLFAEIAQTPQSNHLGLPSSTRENFRHLELLSFDGLFRASGAFPTTPSAKPFKLPMYLTGGSALSLVLRESPALFATHPESHQQLAHFVLQPANGDSPKGLRENTFPFGKSSEIESRIELGVPQDIKALAPGKYDYLAWTSRSQVVSGSIEFTDHRTRSLELELVPSLDSGAIRIHIRGSHAPEFPLHHLPSLFLLLESTNGPERIFIAQTKQQSIVSSDAPIRWTVENNRRIGSAVFRHIPKGSYRLSTAPGFGLSPETSFVKLGDSVELRLLDQPPFN